MGVIASTAQSSPVELHAELRDARRQHGGRLLEGSTRPPVDVHGGVRVQRVEQVEEEADARAIEDDPNNTTRFAVLGQQDAAASGKDKTSFVMSAKNRPGAIHELLTPLAQRKVSMTRLESRPSRTGLWEYVFFVDIEGHEAWLHVIVTREPGGTAAGEVDAYRAMIAITPGIDAAQGAVEAARRGWQARALAHHARAMALYPQPYFQKIAALLKQAQMSVVSDPHTGPLHAPVKELLEEGVNVCLGQDDISDGYYPFGRNNMLEVAFLAAHLFWMTTNRDLEILYNMITVNAARAINLDEHELKVGAPANLVVLGAPNVLEALREHQAPLHVISHGKLIDRNGLEAVIRTGEW